jgi:hypothetical protein
VSRSRNTRRFLVEVGPRDRGKADPAAAAASVTFKAAIVLVSPRSDGG